MWLLIAFIAVPIIEIALFIQIGGFLGLFPTLAIVGLNGNRRHIFGTGSGAFSFITTTIAFSRNERPIRTTGARGHDFVFRCAASDPWIFYRFYWIFIADPKCPRHCFSKSERTYKYTEVEF